MHAPLAMSPGRVLSFWSAGVDTGVGLIP